ncbi:MAG: UDP-glucose 4-epimerase [Myxococcota bacterium]|jgi:UDP-glucose 4-epimerase
MSVLISGAAGRLASIVAQQLAGEDLVGLDVRALPEGRTFGGPFHRVKRYDHRKVAEVFRQHRPRALIHLGIRAATAAQRKGRFTQNVLGTRHLLQLCQRYDVERVVVLGTFHVYGAHEHNAVHIREDAPLKAGAIFPELIDTVELDHTVSNFVYRHRDVHTVLLRAVHIVGPRLQNLMSRLLRSSPTPRLLGFNPLMQFLFEDDAADAIVTALRGTHAGVYNVAGEGAVPYTHAIRLAGGRPLSVPHFLAYPLTRLLAGGRLMPPRHLIDYFRYATIIDDGAFRLDFDWTPRHNTVETLHWTGVRQR